MYAPKKEKEYQKWFREARYGIFLHWGPYAALGHGEQSLFRDHMDPVEYEKKACRWNPQHFDAAEWAAGIKKWGAKYACLTTRHHDGYCLWDSAYTDYTSMKQAPKRDFVREYAGALRAEGLKVGLYYSWLDWRVPAYFEGPEKNPDGWATMKQYIHHQLEELMTKYGKIDYLFFDGAWPRTREELGSVELVEKIREWQPGIMINNRIGKTAYGMGADGNEMNGEAVSEEDPTDFGTPERKITAQNGLWESCDVTTWRWWGYSVGEHFKSSAVILDTLCDAAVRGGNLLMNVAPDADGLFDPEIKANMDAVGQWLAVNGEAIYGAENGDLTEFLTCGWQTVKGNDLYLIIRFRDHTGKLRVNDLVSDVRRVTLLSDNRELPFEKVTDLSKEQNDLMIYGLPTESPAPLFPVIKVECTEPPRTNEWGTYRNWEGDPDRVARWARQRGESVFVESV